jgi:DNA-binding XRE family transcriptional regulator
MSKNTDKELLAEIKDIKENFDEKYAEQATGREAYFNAPENREQIAATRLALDLTEELYRARKKARLTQKQLAKKIHTRQSYIAQIEKGRKNITLRTLEQYASACGKQVKIKLV